MALSFKTRLVTCVASTSATRMTASSAFVVRSLVVTAHTDNAGTLFVSDSTSGVNTGIPITKGNSINLGPVTSAGRTFDEIKADTVYVKATGGTGDKVIFTWF